MKKGYLWCAIISTVLCIGNSIAAPGQPGSILREVYTGISGDAINDLKSNSLFPDKPSQVTYVPAFEAPVDWANDYGTRMRGYVQAPEDGNYTFYFAGDDNCELYLSTSESPTAKIRIASVPEWTLSREWGKFPEQIGGPIALKKNQYYYIEALQKEGTGGDHLSVGWTGPGINGTTEMPIPGFRLSPVDYTPPYNGLKMTQYAGEWSGIPDFTKLTPQVWGYASNCDITLQSQTDNFAREYEGYIFIHYTDNYTFRLTSDDGSKLYIDGKYLILNDGLHGMTSKTATLNNLSAGYHRIRVTYFEKTGQEGLKLEYSTFVNPTMRPIPDCDFFTTQPSNAAQGLNLKMYADMQAYSQIPDFDKMSPRVNGRAPNFDIRYQDGLTSAYHYQYSFDGFINIITAGTYTFSLNSDDGSKLYIDGSVVIHNDNAQSSPTERSVTLTHLSAGYHSIRVDYLANASTANKVLQVFYEGPGISKQQIPNSVLFCENPVDNDDYTQWKYSSEITINASNFGFQSDILDFPLLVTLSQANFSFEGCSADGRDLRFALPDGTHLDYEIERFDLNFQRAEIWVRVPVVYADKVDQYLLMFWGKDGAVDRSASSKVFGIDNKFQAVYHFSPLDNFKDATPNANTLTNSRTVEGAGMVGMGRYFDKTAFLSAPDRPCLEPTAFTISCWYKSNGTQDAYSKLVDKGYTGEPYPSYSLELGNPATSPKIQIATTDAQYHAKETTPSPLELVNWIHVVGTYQGTSFSGGTRGALQLYVNGNYCGQQSITNTSVNIEYYNAMGSFPLFIGAQNGGQANFKGDIDEVEISSTPRSADWIKLSYENQKNFQSLIKVGPVRQMYSTVYAGISDPATLQPEGLGLGGGSYTEITGNNGNGAAYTKGISIIPTSGSTSPLFVRYHIPEELQRLGVQGLSVCLTGYSSLIGGDQDSRVVIKTSNAQELKDNNTDATFKERKSEFGIINVDLTGVKWLLIECAGGTIPATMRIDYLRISVYNRFENYSADWHHSKTVSFNTTKASGADVANDLENFPALISLTNQNFDFSEANTDGRDIRFVDSDGSPLWHDIESWDPSNNQATIWVNIPSIRGNSFTGYVKMYWGNTKAADLSSATQVFSTKNNYQAVYHFKEKALLKDATANHFDLNSFYGSLATPSTAQALGQVGYSVPTGFAGGPVLPQYYTATDNNRLEPQNHTLSCWVKPTTTQAPWSKIIDKGYTGFPYPSYTLEMGEDRIYFKYQLALDGSNPYHTSPVRDYYMTEDIHTNVVPDKWYYVCATYDSLNRQGMLYVDGRYVDVIKNSAGVESWFNSYNKIDYYTQESYDLFIGAQFGGDANFTGCVDEVNIASIARTPEWIRACYQNQKDNQTLVKYSDMYVLAQEAYVDNELVYTLQGNEMVLDHQNINTPQGTIGRYEPKKSQFTDDVFFYYIKDHLGSTRMVMTDKGSFVEATVYTAYGEVKNLMALPGSEKASKEKFTGKEYDEDGAVYDHNGVKIACGLKLGYWGARYYDPEVGIWTSMDPKGQLLNPYGYIANPLSFVDPDGTEFWAALKAGLESIAATVVYNVVGIVAYTLSGGATGGVGIVWSDEYGKWNAYTAGGVQLVIRDGKLISGEVSVDLTKLYDNLQPPHDKKSNDPGETETSQQPAGEDVSSGQPINDHVGNDLGNGSNSTPTNRSLDIEGVSQDGGAKDFKTAVAMANKYTSDFPVYHGDCLPFATTLWNGKPLTRDELNKMTVRSFSTLEKNKPAVFFINYLKQVNGYDGHAMFYLNGDNLFDRTEMSWDRTTFSNYWNNTVLPNKSNIASYGFYQ